MGQARGTIPSTRVRVFDVDCFGGRFDDAVTMVVDRARDRLGGYVVQGNAHVLMTAQSDPELMRALRDAWLVMPDGTPVTWLQRRLGVPGAERVGGPDLMPAVIDRGREHELRHFFLGSTPRVLELLVSRFHSDYPGVEIAGSFSPPFSDGTELDGAAITVTASRPDVVWVALGAPKQELWLRRNTHKLGSAVALGVGAAFDFCAGTKERAPTWMQDAGVEWLHRLAREPRRLTRRYAATNSAFALRSARLLTRRAR